MTGVVLPGRAIDVVHAAAHAAGVPLRRISLTLDPYLSRPGWVRLLVTPDPNTPGHAETLLRQLGVAEPVARITEADGMRQARYEHECTAVGQVEVVIYVTEDVPPAQPAADVAALVAEVDAARAAADEAASA